MNGIILYQKKREIRVATPLFMALIIIDLTGHRFFALDSIPSHFGYYQQTLYCFQVLNILALWD